MTVRRSLVRQLCYVAIAWAVVSLLTSAPFLLTGPDGPSPWFPLWLYETSIWISMTATPVALGVAAVLIVRDDRRHFPGT